MRAAALALLFALCGASCGQTASEADYGAGEPQGDGDGSGAGESPDSPDGIAACAIDDDCVAAASTCCECPTFAVPGGDGYNDGCEEVDCEAAPPSCPALEPACDDGVCTLRCAPVATEQSCAYGFVRDDAGCLIDECAAAPGGAATCSDDADCARVPADCCGCDRGGEDTAVPRDQVDAHLESLGCSGDSACPEVDVCDPDEVPMCVGGQCALARQGSEPGDGGELCGTPELSPCPEGEICMLNAIDESEAAELDVGVCRQP